MRSARLTVEPNGAASQVVLRDEDGHPFVRVYFDAAELVDLMRQLSVECDRVRAQMQADLDEQTVDSLREESP